MMMNHIVIKESSMVRPAQETPRRTLWLSSLDLTVISGHTGSIHAYRPTKNSDPKFFDTDILKESLTKVLVPFYPMAGRLKEDNNGRFEIDCNAKGALFVEAETTHALADFKNFEPCPELKSLRPSCDYSKDLDSIPLFMVQLTRFSCVGVTLGFAQHHWVQDGHAGIHFINSWATIAKGLQLEFEPVHERNMYLAPRCPPQIKFQHSEFDLAMKYSGDSKLKSKIENKPTTASLFKLTKDQIDALKRNATSSERDSYTLSTYQVLAAHILRTTCKARQLPDDQDVRLYIPVDGRFKLKNPALPQGYFGNATFVPSHVAKSGDITGNSLGYVSRKICETLKIVTDEEYLRSTIDYIESFPKPTSLARVPQVFNYPNLSINSWLRLPFYESDFGWGKPFIAGRASREAEGSFYLVPGSETDQSIFLRATLLTEHMVLFEKYLYEF